MRLCGAGASEQRTDRSFDVSGFARHTPLDQRLSAVLASQTESHEPVDADVQQPSEEWPRIARTIQRLGLTPEELPQTAPGEPAPAAPSPEPAPNPPEEKG